MSEKHRSPNARLWALSLLVFLIPQVVSADTLPADSGIARDLALILDDIGEDEWIEVIVRLEDPPRDGVSILPVQDMIMSYRQSTLDYQDTMIRELSTSGTDEIDFLIMERTWLGNSILMKAKPNKVRSIAKRKDVHKVSRNGKVRLVDPVLHPVTWTSEPGVAWGVGDIDADLCWTEGFDGTGVIVAHTDTGVDPDHPALAGKFTGHWFDAVNGEPLPYDDHGHGTHTLGTLLGGDGHGPYPDDLGVAPGAEWVGVKVMDVDGTGTYQQCLEGLEYIAELKETVDIRVVCGSWSLEDAEEDVLFAACERLRELGIVTVFAAGNDGSDSDLADAPGNYPMIIGVGALDRDAWVADFSARGEAPRIAPWTDPSHWFNPHRMYSKPDLTAPGIDVRSCAAGGGFRRLSGTSMAAPHVAGVAALMLQKDPSLTPRDVYDILIGTADAEPAGQHSVDYGWGRIDALAALEGVDLSTATDDLLAASGLKLSSAPFGSGRSLRFALPRSGPVALKVYNLAGQCVRTLAAGLSLAEGPQELVWDGRDDAGRRSTSGVYFARLTASGRSASCKFSLVR